MDTQPHTADPQSRRFPYKLCASDRLKTFGVVVTSLEDLIAKGAKKLGLEKCGAQQAYTVVLENDGTIVEDEDYFMSLPENTRFMILGPSQKWTPVNEEIKISSGTKVDDEVDGDGSVDRGDCPEWKVLAKLLRQSFACIITMSESDLQALIDAPTTELAKELGETSQRTEAIQDSLQRALDNREEQREAKELLKLYKNVFQNDGSEAADEPDHCFNPVSNKILWLNKRIIDVLRQKPSPEFSLSNVELQKVFNENGKDLEIALKCSGEKVKILQQDCKTEFQKRMSKVVGLEQLSKLSTQTAKLQNTVAPIAAAHGSATQY
ncbi:DNA fragmentation factor subunit alpha [Mustelus asterias]